VRTRSGSLSFAAPTQPSRFQSAVWPIHWSALVYIILCFMNLTAIFGAPGRGFFPADDAGTLAGGTTLYVRLETAVSTKTSHLHQAVTARVVREVTKGRVVIVPMGADVTGTIEKLIPASDPSDHARLLLQFNQLVIAGHAALNLNAHLKEVENARETVLQDGTIQGVLAKDVPVGRMIGMLDKLGSPGSEIEKMSDKTFGKADTSIDYPAGVDLILVLDQPLTVDFTLPAAAPAQVSRGSVDATRRLLVDAPQRAQSKAKKPGDPLNLVIVGNSTQILKAFKQAGWSEAGKLDRKSMAGTVRAVASNEGYEQAPVSQLYLYDRAEDLAFEKMLNTFMKRHHLRLWRTAVTTADGCEIWLGASTHDIGLDVHVGVISHAIDSDLDAERAKVGADLMAGGMVAAEQLVSRPNPLSEGKTATGGTWRTDGQMLLIELKASGGM
jgi:hypothetical protein